jgi:hypothetical protein
MVTHARHVRVYVYRSRVAQHTLYVAGGARKTTLFSTVSNLVECY